MTRNKLFTFTLAMTMILPPMHQVAEAQERLTPERLLQMARLGQSALSPDGKTIVYTVSYPQMEADRSNSELLLIGSDGKGRKQLTHTETGEYAPSWLDGGKRIAYLSSEQGAMQLFSIKPDGSDKRQLTQIEGGITGYLFSPDEKRLLFTKEIKFGERVSDRYPDLPKATGRLIDGLMYRHWDEWVESIPHTFWAPLGDAPITEGIDLLEGEPYEAPMKPFGGVEDLCWSPDGTKVAYASRKKVGQAYAISTNSDIYIYDLETKQTTNLTEGMMGYDTHPRFSPDGRFISWISMERDGYEADLRRLFVEELATGKSRHLNPQFECDVEETQWAADSRRIYFRSCIQAETQLFETSLPLRRGRLDLKLPTKLKQITHGQHDYTSMQVEAGTLIAARQSMALPKDIYRVDLKSGRATQLTHENGELLSKLSPITVEKRWIKTTSNEDMLTWVVLPPHFDPNKKYPALLYCQGGPQSTVSQFFSYRWNMRLMAEMGYVVIAPNRHGVPSFGKAWNEQISGDYPGQNMQDYLSAVDAVAQEPWIDKEHIGCIGASYGGFSVYYLAGHHDKRFKAFVSHAGIFNLEMQYVTTEEMWFANWDLGGAPWDKGNAVASRTYAHSPHRFVDKWDTPILVIHGELDYRILAGQGMAAYNAAQLRGIPSELLIYPDENHWILRPQNSLLWHRTFFSWLDRWLKPDSPHYTPFDRSSI